MITTSESTIDESAITKRGGSQEKDTENDKGEAEEYEEGEEEDPQREDE